MKKTFRKSEIFWSIVLVLLLMSFLLTCFLAFPDMGKIKSVEVKIDKKRKESVKNMSLINEAVMFLRGNGKFLKETLSPEGEDQITSDALSDIERSSKKAGINMMDVKVDQPEKKGANFLNVKLRASGGFNCLARFVGFLQQRPDFFFIKEMKVDKTQRSRELRMSLIVSRFYIKKDLSEKIEKILNFVRKSSELDKNEQNNSNFNSADLEDNSARNFEEVRDFFMETKRAQGTEKVSEEVKIDLRNKFKLIGVILDDQPKAIIEDLKTRKVMFLSKGDHLKSILLVDISEDSVSFDIAGEVQFLEL